MKLANCLLAACGLALAAHLGLTLLFESEGNTRWYNSAEGRAATRAAQKGFSGLYAFGGDPANSALVFYFGDMNKLAAITTDAWDSNVFFDYDGSGRAVRTGWISAESGFLFLDRNHNGAVTSGRELFGNRTGGGDPHFETGLTALAREDSNHDGLIDARDQVWDDLKIWRDANHNGRVDTGELSTLEAAGVTAIELKPQPYDQMLPNVNHISTELPLTTKAGRNIHLFEIYFQRKPGDRRFLKEVKVSPEIEASVPQVAGSGLVRDLREAATREPELKRLVSEFQKAPTRENRLARLDELLMAWAVTGADPVSLSDRVGDRYRLNADCLGAPSSDRYRLLFILRAFYGRSFLILPHELFPGQKLLPSITDHGDSVDIICPANHWEVFDNNYQRIADRVYYALAPTSALSRFYRDWDSGGWGAISARLDTEFNRDPEAALTDLMDLRISLAWTQTAADDFSALDDYLSDHLQATPLTPEMDALRRKLERETQAAAKRVKREEIKPPIFRWGLPNE